MKKPSFRRQGVYSFGDGQLDLRNINELQNFIPKRMAASSTEDRMGDTAAQRVLRSIDQALGAYDASLIPRDSPRGVVNDIVAIGTAAQRLMNEIGRACEPARTAIDEEALYYAIGHADSRLSVTGRLCVDWHGGLQDAGLADIAHAIYADGPRQFSKHERSLLSRLWDLADDALKMATDAPQRIKIDRNNRNDRQNASRFIDFAISCYCGELNSPPPKSSWYGQLVSSAGKYRDLKISNEAVFKKIAALKAAQPFSLAN